MVGGSNVRLFKDNQILKFHNFSNIPFLFFTNIFFFVVKCKNQCILAVLNSYDTANVSTNKQLFNQIEKFSDVEESFSPISFSVI